MMLKTAGIITLETVEEDTEEVRSLTLRKASKNAGSHKSKAPTFWRNDGFRGNAHILSDVH